MRAVIAAFLLGWREADGDMGMTYGHPYTLRSQAYDTGRHNRRRVWALAEARRSAVLAYRTQMSS